MENFAQRDALLPKKQVEKMEPCEPLGGGDEKWILWKVTSDQKHLTGHGG